MTGWLTVVAPLVTRRYAVPLWPIIWIVAPLIEVSVRPPAPSRASTLEQALEVA
ncbi:MAG: hypothetical protein Q8O42_19970 [Acidobacteriota bacterium]|nr:hypothetical protein [Acidobacteriota bacterium]